MDINQQACSNQESGLVASQVPRYSRESCSVHNWFLRNVTSRVGSCTMLHDKTRSSLQPRTSGFNSCHDTVTFSYASLLHKTGFISGVPFALYFDVLFFASIISITSYIPIFPSNTLSFSLVWRTSAQQMNITLVICFLCLAVSSTY
jgi:hypothetical protein